MADPRYYEKCRMEKESIQATSYWLEFQRKLSQRRQHILELCATEHSDEVPRLQGMNVAYKEFLDIWDNLLQEIKKKEGVRKNARS